MAVDSRFVSFGRGDKEYFKEENVESPSYRVISCWLFQEFAVGYLISAVVFVWIGIYGAVQFLDIETAMIVERLTDDDDSIQSIESGDGGYDSNEQMDNHRKLLFSIASPRRLVSLLVEIVCLPIGSLCLAMFAFSSYKSVAMVYDLGRRHLSNGSSYGEVPSSLTKWQWHHAEGIIRYTILLFTILAVGLIAATVFTSVTFIDGAADIFCKERNLCTFVTKTDTSYKHIQKLKASGLTAMTSVSGLVFLFGSIFFAILFGSLAVRMYMMKHIVSKKRDEQKRGWSSQEDSDEEDTPLIDSSHESSALLHRPGHGSVPHRHRKFKTKLVLILVVFLALLPLLIFASIKLPDSFTEINVDGRETSSKIADHLDVLIFYGFLYVGTLCGLLSQLSDTLRRLFLRRSKLVEAYAPRCIPFSISNGQVVLMLLLSALIGGETVYFLRVHSFKTPVTAYPKTEFAGRVVGSVAKVFLGLLLLPVTHNSIWAVAFKINRAAMILAHQWIGNVFLGLMLSHGALMTLTADRATFPWLTYPDNFTIPLVCIASTLVLLNMGLLSREFIRRWIYELFFVAHISAFVVLIPSVFLHADGAWKFALGGVVLMIADYTIKLTRATSLVKLNDTSLYCNGEVLRISYVIDSGGNICTAPNTKKLLPLLHGMGQHVYINVPQISKWEWHPFSISSAAEDEETTHHIKSMGEGSFTEKLLQLAASSSETNYPIRVNIDGPYGVPLDYTRYEKIIFVAGGMGITNIHSSFKTLYVLAKAGLLPVTRVHLIWVAKNPSYFDMFQDTFRTVEQDSLHTRFKFSFYATQQGVNNLQPATVPFQIGRPNLLRELVGLSAYGMHALINASGPALLRETCHRLAIKCGVDFLEGSFEL